MGASKKRSNTDETDQADKSRKKSEETTPIAYVSPIKKIKLSIQARETTNVDKPIISTGEGFQDFARKNGTKVNNVLQIKNEIVRNSVSIRGRVIWTSFHMVETGPVARFHLIDLRANGPLDEMYASTCDKYATQKMAVDNQLITVSVYGVDEQAIGLPNDGQIATVARTTKLSLFMDTVCQVTAKLHDISVSDERGGE